jgi:predicted transposase/invertase (TIGR01784 family)
MGKIMTKTDKAYLEVIEELGYAKSLREEGREKGREEGIEEGILKGKRETALAMKKKGFDHETIAQITGLGVDEIIKIKIK